MSKSRVSAECMDAAKAALKTFKEVDLEKYVAHVLDKMRSHENLHGTDAVQKAIAEVNDERMQGYFEALQTKVNDAAKAEKRATPIREGKMDLLQTLVRRIKGLGDNVEAAQRSAFKRLMDKFFNILSGEELGFIYNDKNDLDICRAIDGKPASDLSKKMAEKYETYTESRNVESVTSNALPLRAINKDRFLRAVHDTGRLLRGGRSLIQSALGEKFTIKQARDAWKEKILPLLNMAKTFFDTPALDLDGKVNMAEVHKILDEIFDNITTGKPELISRGTGSQNMFFYWKDMESWMTYNKEYGRGNLFNAMLADIQSSSNKIGMAEMFGSNPTATYNDLAKIENESNPVGASRKNQAKLAFNWVSGQDRAPVSANVSSFFAALRALTSGAKLVGRVTFLSIPDIANGIMFAHRWGHDYFKSYGTYLSGMFNAIPSEERTFLANSFKEMTDTHLGYLARFMEANDVSGVLNNINATLYRWTLMEALDRGNKLSAIQLQSRILGENSKLEFGALSDQMKKMLGKFNISESEWNMLRNKTTDFQGKKLFTMDSMDQMTNDDLRKIYGVDAEHPMYQLRNDLYRKVYAMFDVASENSVLTPGAFMKAMSTFGSRAGTVHGELLRSIMQFKMYPLEFVDRVLYQGLQNADGVQAKLMFGALLFGATIPMSYLSIYLDNIGKGKTIPDWDRMNFGDKIEFSKNLLLPGIGIMGSFYSPDKPYLQAGSFFTTPAIQLLYDSIKLPYRVSEGAEQGDMKKIAQAFGKVGRNVMPGSGMPFVSPYMRQMFGDKPFLQPGQTQVYGS